MLLAASKSAETTSDEGSASNGMHKNVSLLGVDEKHSDFWAHVPWVSRVGGGGRERAGTLVQLAHAGGSERHNVQGARAVTEAYGPGRMLWGQKEQQPVVVLSSLLHEFAGLVVPSVRHVGNETLQGCRQLYRISVWGQRFRHRPR